MKVSRRMRRNGRRVALALLLAAMGGGCSSVIDHIPTSMGGLPEGTPPRAAVQPAYPNVHDMPPARQDTALSEAERNRLREDLKGTRARIAPPPEVAAGANAGGAHTP
jgi:hypothetical protein